MINKKKEVDNGTETGRNYYLFQKELSGYVLEQNGMFVPKWLAFSNGITPEQLITGSKRVKARLYTAAEKIVRFTNL